MTGQRVADNLRDRIAAVQQAHTIRLDYNHPRYGDCHCGYKTGAQDRDGEDFDEFWWERHATHVADVLIREMPELQPCPFCHLSHNRCDCLRTAND